MDTDRNLLFGVLALQADLIDPAQFIEACLLWTGRKQEALADLLIERGWIDTADRAHVEYLVQRKLRKHDGDARASLAGIPENIKHSLAALTDDDIQRSIGGPAVEPAAVATIDHVADPTERYRRLRLHATGGIGRVWLAHDHGLGRHVALKELRPERAEHATYAARFLQEAQITGQLEHPGIIPVYDLIRAQDGAQPFYTMRFVKGRTLSDAARAYHEQRRAGNEDPVALPALLNAFVTVCNTIGYAHSRGVIHRDLKGGNVLLGDFGEVVVLDWGLAKVVGRPECEAPAPSLVLDAGGDSGYTVQGQALGTPAYMAPEQAAGRLDLIERATDVYGLGAMLYEILTGTPPFTGATTEEVLRKVRDEQPVPPHEYWLVVPPALEAVCLRALAKQPAARPASATELAHAVQLWQEFERRKAEEALRASEALYHSLVETLPLSVWRKDLDGQFTFGNRRFCESVAPSLEQLIGKTDHDFFPAELADKYRQDDLRVHRTATTYATAEEHVTASGEKLFVEVVKSPILDAAGQVVGTQGIFWDVTARKRAEAALQRQTEILQSILNSMSDGVIVADETGKFLLWNPAAERFLRKPGENVAQANWAEYYGCYLADMVTPYPVEQMPLSRAMRGEAVDEAEVSIRHEQLPEGVVLSISGRPLRHKDGTLGGGVIVFRDVTARKRIAEELRRSRERFELAVLASQDGLWDWDVERDQVWYSAQMRRMLGYDEEEFPNRPGETEKRVHPDDHARWRAALHGHVTGATDHLEMEYRIRHKDGSYRWVRDRGVSLRRPDGRAYRIAGSREDITQRKRSEEELAHERYLLHTLMDHLPDGIYFKDSAGRFLRVNKAVADSLGLDDAAQAVGRNHFDFFTEESARNTMADDLEIMRTGRPVVEADERITWPDGREGWLSTTKMPFRDGDDNVIGVFGVSRDITARKRAETALRRSEERYRSVIAAMQDGIVILDPDGNIVSCNAAAERILGLSAEQIMGRTPHDPRWRAIHEDGSPFPGETHPPMITLRTGQPCTDVVMGVHKPDGTLTWITVNAQPLFEADGRTLAGVAASFEDITERKRIEAALRQAHEQLARVQASPTARV